MKHCSFCPAVANDSVDWPIDPDTGEDMCRSCANYWEHHNDDGTKKAPPFPDSVGVHEGLQCVRLTIVVYGHTTQSTLKPSEARKLAQKLLRAADNAEQQGSEPDFVIPQPSEDVWGPNVQRLSRFVLEKMLGGPDE